MAAETAWFETMRSRLEHERDSVQLQLALSMSELADATESQRLEGAGTPTHLADEASDALVAEFTASNLPALRERLQAIDAALVRIEQGTYGTCVDCGRPIVPERLEALPETVRCLQCQERFENRLTHQPHPGVKARAVSRFH